MHAKSHLQNIIVLITVYTVKILTHALNVNIIILSQMDIVTKNKQILLIVMLTIAQSVRRIIHTSIKIYFYFCKLDA